MLDVNTLLRSQGGAIHDRQVRAAGLTQRQIANRLRTGAWTETHDLVYVVSGAPATYPQVCWAAVLAVRFSRYDGSERRVAVGGFSAAHLHGFDVPEPRRVDLVVPVAEWTPRLRGVRIVRAQTWPRRVFGRDDGLVLTSAADTLVDIAWYVTKDHLHTLVQQAAFDARGLPRAILAACRRGRTGSAAARRAAALVLAGVDSALHERGRALVVEAGLPEPECGVVVAQGAGPSDCVLRVPGATAPPYGLVVEWDGDAHRVDRRTFLHDREKDRLVRRACFRTLRYTADQVSQRTPVVLDLCAEWEASLQVSRPVPA